MNAPTRVGDTPLRRIRESRQLSQAQVAEAAHTSQAQIDRLEKRQRKMTVSWAKRLAAVLECHWLDLLDEPRAKPLSTEEQSLIERYRDLSDDDRQAIFRHAEALSGRKPRDR